VFPPDASGYLSSSCCSSICNDLLEIFKKVVSVAESIFLSTIIKLMENIMIPNKYILAPLLCAFLFSGCAPSLRSPAPPKTSTGETQQSAPTPGSFDPATPDERTKRPPYRPGQQQVPIEPTPESMNIKMRFLLPSSKFVNDRILEYEKKLSRWKDIDNQSAVLNLNREDTEKMVHCFRDIQKIMNGYNNMHDLIQQTNTDTPVTITEEDILELQKNDIAFMEGECNRMLTAPQERNAGQAKQKAATDLSQMETLIKRHSDNREYEEVVQTWSKIPDAQIGDIDLKTRIFYGNALMFLHQEEKAAEVYQQIVNQISASNEQRTDLLSLRKILADLYTASGNYPAAQKQYMSIAKDYQDLGSVDEWSKKHLTILEHNDKNSPELTQYSGILRNYMGFIPEQDGFKIIWQVEKFLKAYPNSPVVSNVEMIKTEVSKRAEVWFNGVFAEADKLAADRRYSEAIKKLQTIPDDIISPDQRLKIRDRSDALVLSDAVERETVKIGKAQDLQRRWNEGTGLIDEGKFDDAVKVFNGLQDTEYAAKAAEKIREISTLAAKADRRKAADLFIRFTKTPDLENKKKLLLESRRLLADILVKYPNIDFTDKVTENLRRVEKEIAALDAKLMPGGEKAQGDISPENLPDIPVDENAPEITPGKTGKIQEKNL
jgi:tetratricopeptide (TPR) repeat protein